MFDRLPPELVRMIVVYVSSAKTAASYSNMLQVDDVRDLKHLSAVDKCLHQHVEWKLYQRLVIHPASESPGDSLDLSIMVRSPQYLAYVEALEFAAPFHYGFWFRCTDDVTIEQGERIIFTMDDAYQCFDPHAPETGTQAELSAAMSARYEGGHEVFLQDLGARLDGLLERLKPGKLRSFRFEDTK